MKQRSLLGAGIALALLLILLPAASTASASAYPPIIPLPNGFQPEGVVVGKGNTLYAGSLANGAIYQVNLRSGEGSLLAEGEEGRTTVGLAFDERSGYLYAAGGPSGNIYVFDTASGDLVTTLFAGQGFINDAIVTRDAVYVTNSPVAEFYRVPLGPAGQLVDGGIIETYALPDVFGGGGFNANGIEASANGEYVLIVNSSLGALFRVEVATGTVTQLDLGGDSVVRGDGILLVGQTLYVVQNFFNQIAVVELSPDFLSGRVVDIITNDAFRIPTTVASQGSRLYAVNARFGTPPTPSTEYEIVQVRR